MILRLHLGLAVGAELLLAGLVDKIGNVQAGALPFIAICFSHFGLFAVACLTLTKKRHLQIGQRQLSLGS